MNDTPVICHGACSPNAIPNNASLFIKIPRLPTQNHIDPIFSWPDPSVQYEYLGHLLALLIEVPEDEILGFGTATYCCVEYDTQGNMTRPKRQYQEAYLLAYRLDQVKGALAPQGAVADFISNCSYQMSVDQLGEKFGVAASDLLFAIEFVKEFVVTAEENCQLAGSKSGLGIVRKGDGARATWDDWFNEVVPL